MGLSIGGGGSGAGGSVGGAGGGLSTHNGFSLPSLCGDGGVGCPIGLGSGFGSAGSDGGDGGVASQCASGTDT